MSHEWAKFEETVLKQLSLCLTIRTRWWGLNGDIHTQTCQGQSWKGKMILNKTFWLWNNNLFGGNLTGSMMECRVNKLRKESSCYWTFRILYFLHVHLTDMFTLCNYLFINICQSIRLWPTLDYLQLVYWLTNCLITSEHTYCWVGTWQLLITSSLFCN